MQAKFKNISLLLKQYCNICEGGSMNGNIDGLPRCQLRIIFMYVTIPCNPNKNAVVGLRNMRQL